MERHSQVGPSVRFGPFELDVRSAELHYNGHTTPLHEQPFQVLLALLERPGELISREELVHRLWPDGTFVDYERGLNKAVNKLRDVLRDSADSPRFVETIPRRGYRFIAPLEGNRAPINGSSGTVVVETGTRHKPWMAIGAAVTVALIAAAGYSGYSLLSRKHEEPFENFTISQITNTGKVASAAISPDGKFLLSVVDDHRKESLWLRNISTNSDTEVIPPADALYDTGLAFSPDGNYIYFRKLDIPTFDLLRAPVLGGSPKVVVRDIDGNITFSPGGKRMAYVRMNDPEVGKFQVLTANADGTDEKMLAGGRLHGFQNAVAWSPDGKQIASAIPGLGDALGGLQLVDATSGKTQTLSLFNKPVNDLAWLPDGRGLLAIFGNNYGRAQVGFVSNPGGQFRNITKDTNSYDTLTLSADGKTLAMLQQRTSQTLYLMPAAGFAGRPPNPARAQNKGSATFGWASNGDLYFDGDALLRISADGHNKTMLLSDPTPDIMWPVSCGDGRYILFLRASHDGSNKISTWRVDADGSNPKQLTDGTQDGGHQCSPDSKWAYYYDFNDGQIKRVSIDGGTPEIVPGTVMPRTFIGSDPDISRDGKQMAFLAAKLEPTGPIRIALVNLDAGSEPPSRMLDPDPRIWGGWARFTPDGKALVYRIREDGVENLWLQPLDGSRGGRITNFQSDGIQMFVFSPDGKTLGLLHSHSESDVVLLRDTGSSPQ